MRLKLHTQTASEHILIENGKEFPIDKEYANIGMTEGFLLWNRTERTRAGKVTKYYFYKNGHIPIID